MKFFDLLRAFLFFLGLYPFKKITDPKIQFYVNDEFKNSNTTLDLNLISGVFTLVGDLNIGSGYHPNFFCRMQDGLSGQKFRQLLSGLANLESIKSYMEVGTFTGSTLLSFLTHKLPKDLKVVSLDNWFKSGSSPNLVFRKLAKMNPAKINNLSILSEDMYDFRFDSYKNRFDVFFYDGPHSYEDQLFGVRLADACLKSTGILIVDDWNVARVRKATYNCLQQLDRVVLASIEIESSPNDIKDTDARFGHWGRGVGLFIVKKLNK